MILSYTLILPTSQLQTQQAMTHKSDHTRIIFNTSWLYSCAHL